MNAGEQLWELAEAEQGFAYISDAVTTRPNKEVFEIARGSLHHSENYVRALRAWLRRNGELNGIAAHRTKS